jgi:hypothetical protein
VGLLLALEFYERHVAMRFFFRALALLSLSIAVISAVVDVARSLSASGLTLTSLQKGWGLVSPSSLAALEVFFLAWLPMPTYLSRPKIYW